MTTVDLSKFDNHWYQPGSALRRLSWILVNAFIFRSDLPFPSSLKCRLLRAFGARIGTGVVIKPNVNIKYPWFLAIGSHSWIGEGAWIDNLAQVTVGDHACISQGAYLLTGNHDYKSERFDLIVGPIFLEDGAWVGAKAIVTPGTTLKTHAIVTTGSVIGGATEAYMIYRGNPAQPIRRREISSVTQRPLP